MIEGIRTAWISGASSGIGAALAERLAARGVEVILSARRQDALEALAARIRASGGAARVEPLDVSDPVATTEALLRIDDEVSGIDLVVANAGVGGSRWAGKLRWEDCAQTLRINVDGAVASLLAVLPRMVERGRGHLVGISSLAGYRGMPASAAYSASKAFLMVFLESLRVDLRDTGVFVTDVRPGFVRTPMTDRNRFHMPFLMQVGDAAERIVAGIERRRQLVTFPWPLAAATRLARIVPPGLWDRVIARDGQGHRRQVFDEPDPGGGT
ncbi:MAG TPA: SDR family NAD(P)-dependent oxidoreductase [Vulgatibacter sp.]|nr:SDR family NAD(P)-dependent oxidoreductase [Vulgatibacter sp.]